MSLTAKDMRELDDDARDRATESCRSFLAEAVRSLRDTGEPVETLALLCAMWSGYAKRPDQSDALDDAGLWLERRLVRTPDISVDRLTLELGWLQRLITIHIPRDKRQRGHGPGGDERDTPRERNDPGRRPAFGGSIEALRRRRANALQAAAPPPAEPTPPPPPVPLSLPDILEVRFASDQVAIDAFQSARERRKKKKAVKPRALPVRPVVDALVPIAGEIVCTLTETEGMSDLESRFIANSGRMPSFWVAVVDLVPDDGKRRARRILLDPIASTTRSAGAAHAACGAGGE